MIVFLVSLFAVMTSCFQRRIFMTLMFKIHQFFSDDRADDDFPIMIEKIPLGGNNGPRGTC